MVEKDAGGQVLSSQLYYYLTDHASTLLSTSLGSTAQLLNGSNGIVSGSTTRYLPYSGYRTTPTQTITNRDFTGQKENMELGLLYYNARFYVPGIGRFASADTLVPDPANPQSYNRYSYVRNRVLNFTDPTGHRDCEFDGHCGPPPRPKPSSPPQTPLVIFDVAATITGEEFWTANEIAAVEAGAWQVAGAIFRGGNGQFNSYREAFLKVYGGPVTFRKTGQSCAGATGATFCFAQVQSSRLVHVYTDIYDNSGNSRIPGPNTSDRWAVHELGHAFESRVNGRVGTWGHVRSQLPDNVLNRNGFAGDFPGWQQSRENTRGEIFADMFVGWSYGQWSNDEEQRVFASLKTDFMAANMSVWIDIATQP